MATSFTWPPAFSKSPTFPVTGSPGPARLSSLYQEGNKWLPPSHGHQPSQSLQLFQSPGHRDLQDYQVFIKRETNGYLLHMATSFLKVSNFSSHRVKFVRGMTEEMQQIIDKSRIVLDQVPAPPAMILDVVRPSRDQIQEELRRCHKQLPPDESGEDTSQDATSQLGKAS